MNTLPGVLPTVRLGATGPVVGTLGLGCMGMSEFYGPTDVEESLRTLDRALECGVTLFDTADNYGHGGNEELIGPFIRAHRDQVTIATKFGLVRKVDDPYYRGIDNTPGYMRGALEGSLRRLGVETIDLFYAHRLDPDIPVEETVGAMAALVEEGKVRYLGLSEVSGAALRAAHAVHPIAAVQSEWSLFSRDVEADAVPAAAELGVAFVPYSPLGRGFLAASFRSVDQLSEGDYRRSMPRFTGQNGQHNGELLDIVREIGAAHGATPAQVALAWLHHQGAARGMAVVPIPGTRRRSRLEENVGAAAVSLTAEELAVLEPIASKVAGSRLIGLSFTAVARDQTESEGR